MQSYTNDKKPDRHYCIMLCCEHTPSNCSSLHVNVRNVVYLHKQRYRSARRRQFAVKFQLQIVTRCQSFGIKCLMFILGDV